MLVLIAVLGALDAAIVLPVPRVGDWYQFWHAGRIVASGGSPYDPSAWSLAAQEAEVVENVVNAVRLNCSEPASAACRWLYPPWTALVLAPFGALPAALGLPLLAVAVIAAGLGSLFLLFRRFPPPPAAPTLPLAMALAAQPLVLATRTGHLDALLLIGAMLVIPGLRGSTLSLVAGALLLSLKPHLFIAFAVIVVAVLVWRRRWSAIAITSGTVLSLAAASFARFPLPEAWLANAAGRVSFDVPAIWALASAWLPEAQSVVVVALLLFATVLAGVALSGSHADRDALLVATGLGLSLVSAPYEHTYDHVLLLPAVVLMIEIAARLRPFARATWLAAATAIGVLYPWIAYFADFVVGNQLPSALVPISTLAGLAAVTVAARTAPDSA
ncbi:hypothetical protein BH18CHL2_BH18CHL2_06580 [soil metagenome]